MICKSKAFFACGGFFSLLHSDIFANRFRFTNSNPVETLPYNKRKNVVKKVKKSVNARWPSFQASVDRVYEEYVGLLEAFSTLETEGGSGGSMVKDFSKLLKSPEFVGMFYTLRVKLPSLIAK